MNLKRKLTVTEIISLVILFVTLLLCVMVLFTLSGVPRSHARHTTCTSNQKYMTLTVQIMLEENEHLSLPTDKELWKMTFELAGNKRVLVCPEFTRSKEGRAKKGDVLGYGYNAKLIGKKMSDFEDPTTIIFTADANTTNNLIKSTSDIDFKRHKRNHKYSGTLSFLDGHVEAIRESGMNFKEIMLADFAEKGEPR